MRRLPQSTIDAVEAHRSIVAAKSTPRRQRLDSKRVIVEARIHALLTSGPVDFPPHALEHECQLPCTPCLRADLKHLWSGETGALRALKAKLRQELGTYPCAYCGINSANTFDHYLPVAVYPEFAVTSTNLVPCCSECNGLKHEHVATSAERVLYPTLDPVDQPILTCEIDDQTVPAPRFAVSVDLPQDLPVSIAEFHFTRLRLAERFMSAVVAQFAEFQNMLHQYGIPWGPEAASLARTFAQTTGAQSMPNAPMPLLWKAVAAWMDQFLEPDGGPS